MDRDVYTRMRTLEQSHWWFTARREILSRMLGGLGLPPAAKILEAGCGVGGNLEMLQAFGEVEALEPDAPSRDYIRTRYGLTPSDGLLPGPLPYAAERFDAVCAFDVVEHVDDDAGAVRALAGLVAPGGYMMVTVPAYAWMWSRHDEQHHHKRRYRRAQITGLFEAAGLTLVKASYFNTVLFAPAAAVRLVKRALRIESVDDNLPSPATNTLLHRLFAKEADWLSRGDLPFGLSILVIGRKA